MASTDMSTFIDTIDDDHADFAAITQRLVAAHLAGAQKWTDDGICSAVGIIIGDYDIDSLTSMQVLRISVLINGIWAPYPVHLTRSIDGVNRKTVLKDYIAGLYLDVAALRGHDPTLSARPSPSPSATDAAPPAPPPSLAVAPPPKNIFASMANQEPTQGTLGTHAPSAVRYIAQFYIPARQYGGRDDESLARARTTFFKTCDAFSVPHPQRADCIQFALKQTDHNLPALIHDLDGLSAEQMWDAIANRVTSKARDMRTRTLWQETTLACEPLLVGDTEVTRFERMIGRLVQLQSQMPTRYQSADMLTDKIMEAIHGEWFTATVIPDSAGDPHVLAARIKLMLTTGPPATRSTTPSTTTVTTRPDDGSAPTPTFLTDPASDDANATTDTMMVTAHADDPNEPNRVYYVLKRFRANATTPYRTERATASPLRNFRGPGPNNPCHNCQGTDHFARECPRPNNNSTRTPRGVRLADTVSPPLGDNYSTPPPLEPPPIPLQDMTDKGHIYFLAATWAVSEPPITTAILDIGSPGDIVGDKWLAANPQVVTSPMTPCKARWAMGRDVPATLGYISIRITTTTKAGTALNFDLPQVYVLRHDTVPLLVGLPTHMRLDLVVRTRSTTVLFGDTETPVQCAVQHGHLTIPPGPKPATTTTVSSLYYTRSELSLAHRQFGHASVAALTGALPPHTFSPTDVAALKEIAAACVPCQTHAHLPRRPRYALPPRPLAFNRCGRLGRNSVPIL